MTDTRPSMSISESRQRNAIRIGWIIAGMAIFLMFWGVYSLYINFDVPRIAFMGCYIILLLTGLFDVWLSRRGRSDIGILLIIGLLLTVVVLIGVLLVGQGLIFLMLSILLVSVISILALSPRYQFFTIAASVIVGLFALFFDQYVVADWRREASLPFSTPLVAGILIIVYAAFIARQLRNFSLRAKLVLTFLFVSLMAISIVSGLTNMAVQTQLSDASDRALLTGAMQTSALLDSFIQNNLDTVRVEAQNPDIVDLLEMPASERAGSDLARKVTLILQGYVDRDADFITSYALLDLDGIDIIDTFTPDIGLTKDDRLYFQQPLETGLPYASPVIFSPTFYNKAGIYFGAPVLGDDGEIVGVLRLRHSVETLQKIVSDASGLAGEQSFAVLLDEYGVCLAHGLSAQNAFKSVVPLSAATIADLQGQRRLPDLPAEQLSTDLPEFAAGLANVEQQPVFTAPLESLDGKSAVGAAHHLGTQNWSLVFFQPQDVYLSVVRSQTRILTVLGVIVAFAVAGAAAFVAQWLSRPITHLTAVARKVGDGDLSVRADVQSLDEVGSLATVFNLMTDQLAETIGTLEQQVSERTRALETSAEVSRRLSTILDQKQLVREVVEQLQSAFGYYHAHIYLFDASKQNLIMVGGTGEAGQAMLARGHKIARGRGLVGRAAETNAIVLVLDVSQAEGWLSNPLLPDTKCEVAVPIAIGPDVLGVLDVQHDIVDGMGQQDADLIQSIANQVAVAVQNAQAYERAQRQADREARIAAISQRIQEATTIDDVLKVAVGELGQALGVHRASVDLKPSSLRAREERN